MKIILIVVFLAGASAFDICTNKVPNWYILSGFISIFLTEISGRSIREISLIPIYCILTILILFPLYLLGAFGAADVKIAGVLSVSYSIKYTMIILATAVLIGGLVSIVKLIRYGSWGDRIPALIRYISSFWDNSGMRIALPNQSYIDGLAKKDREKASIPVSPLILCSVVMLEVVL